MAGEAPDYGSMIGDILGNPEAMEGVMQVAKAMGLGSAFGASGKTGSNDSNDRNAPSVSSGSDSAVTGSSLSSNGAKKRPTHGARAPITYPASAVCPPCLRRQAGCRRFSATSRAARTESGCLSRCARI